MKTKNSPLPAMPEASTGDISKSGKIHSPYEDNQVRNTIIKNAPKIQDCYNQFLKRNPKITDGKIMIDFQIKPGGSVEKSEVVTTDLHDETLGFCITGIVESIVFPEPPSGRKTYISHTFNFKKTS